SETHGLTPSPDFVSQADAIRRLPICVPKVLRKGWVSVEARERFEARMTQVAIAWEMAEWRSADQIRPCALLNVLSPTYADWLGRIHDAGLAQAPLRAAEFTHRDGADCVYSIDVVVGSRRNVKLFRTAWVKNDSDAMGALLGYPACCRTAFDYAF